MLAISCVSLRYFSQTKMRYIHVCSIVHLYSFSSVFSVGTFICLFYCQLHWSLHYVIVFHWFLGLTLNIYYSLNLICGVDKLKVMIVWTVELVMCQTNLFIIPFRLIFSNLLVIKRLYYGNLFIITASITWNEIMYQLDCTWLLQQGTAPCKHSCQKYTGLNVSLISKPVYEFFGCRVNKLAEF